MSMDREAYRLANEIQTELHADGDFLAECPGEEEMKRYKGEILGKIRREKKGRRLRRALTAAACAALLLIAGGMMFGEEVHAALLQMKWSMSSALGLSDDLAKYSEVVRTSVTDEGYVLTLQEVVVSEDEVTVNCTFAREDGAQVGGNEVPYGELYIDGKKANMSSGAQGVVMLNDESTLLGVVENYYLYHEAQFDASKEHTFRLVYGQAGAEYGGSGTWEFAFTASGTDLAADTSRMALGQTFTLPDGVRLTLTELGFNAFDQRISYELAGETSWHPVVEAEDAAGNNVQFNVRSSWTTSAERESGYMQNSNRRLSDGAGTVTLTLYAERVWTENGKVMEEYVQIGEPFEVEW